MPLAWNTRQLLFLEQDNTRRFRTRTNEYHNGEPLAPTPVEFHFLSRRALYDTTADDRRWAVYGDRHWYTVEVVRRSTHELSQELCLSFDCFHRTDVIGDGHMYGDLPIDEVAIEFGMLLSLLVREPLVPIGARRIDGRPVRSDVRRSSLHPLHRQEGDVGAAGISSQELRKIVEGLAKATERDTNAIMAALRLYHAALSMSDYDISTAYFSLVSAIECVSGHHFEEKSFNFDDIEKFRGASAVISKISLLLLTSIDLLGHLKRELVKAEHFVWQKFRDFIEGFLPEEFWQPDKLDPLRIANCLPPIKKEHLRRFLREAYDARSKFAHTGEPFPAHVALGIGDTVGMRAVIEAEALKHSISGRTGRSGLSERFVPSFVWFERLTHLVLREYIHRVHLAEPRRQIIESDDWALVPIRRELLPL